MELSVNGSAAQKRSLRHMARIALSGLVIVIVLLCHCPQTRGDDCNGNNVDDIQDIQGDTSSDCNVNDVPDECDLVDQTSTDCNVNGVPDECDLADQTSTDCNVNGVPDECDLGSALTFADDDAYVDVGAVPSLATDGGFTIEAWIKPSNLSGQQTVLSKCTADGGFAFGQKDGKPLLVMYVKIDDDIYDYAYTTYLASIPLAEWTHIAVTVDDSQTVSFIVNGEPRSSTAAGPLSIPHISTTQTRIGRVPGSGSAYAWKGMIDEVRVWNCVRLNYDIARNMYELHGDVPPQLIAYWPFDEETGSSVADLAGANNGTLSTPTGPTWTPQTPFDANGDGTLDVCNLQERITRGRAQSNTIFEQLSDDIYVWDNTTCTAEGTEGSALRYAIEHWPADSTFTISPGEYCLADVITVTSSGLTIRADSLGSVILKATGGVEGPLDKMFNVKADNVTFENLVFLGEYDESDADAGHRPKAIYVHGSFSETTIKNNVFSAFFSGVLLKGNKTEETHNHEILDNCFLDSGYSTLKVEGQRYPGYDTECEYVVHTVEISGNYLSNNYQGIVLTCADDCRIVNNTVHDTDINGIRVETSCRNNIEGNHSYQNGLSGLLLYARSKHNTINNNIIIDNNAAGRDFAAYCWEPQETIRDYYEERSHGQYPYLYAEGEDPAPYPGPYSVSDTYWDDGLNVSYPYSETGVYSTAEVFQCYHCQFNGEEIELRNASSDNTFIGNIIGRYSSGGETQSPYDVRVGYYPVKWGITYWRLIRRSVFEGNYFISTDANSQDLTGWDSGDPNDTRYANGTDRILNEGCGTAFYGNKLVRFSPTYQEADLDATGVQGDGRRLCTCNDEEVCNPCNGDDTCDVEEGENSENCESVCPYVQAGGDGELGKGQECAEGLLLVEDVFPANCDCDDNDYSGEFTCINPDDFDSTTDCNGDLVNSCSRPYACEAGVDCSLYTDCDGDDVRDETEIAMSKTSQWLNDPILGVLYNGDPLPRDLDCNANGIPDNCDLAGQTSEDCDDNQIPDECQEPDSASGGIIYVDDDAPNWGTGTSWDDAYNALEDALAFARCYSGTTTVTEIRISQGTYTPSALLDTGGGLFDDPTDARTATFQLPDGVIVRGGYAGYGATDPDERDGRLYETVLSGDLRGDDDGTDEKRVDNAYHVVFAEHLSDATLLDGFTITGGCADGVYPHGSGAGMYCYYGAPAVLNCTFLNNYARHSAAGLFNLRNNSTVANCLFLNNSVSGGAGGAMENFQCFSTVTNCTFVANSAGSYAGAIYNNYCFSRITNCIIWGNYAPVDPQMRNSERGSPITTYTCIEGGGLGTGNILADPQFVDADGADDIPGTIDDQLVLSVASPCIDAGNQDALPADNYDLDNNGKTGEPLPYDLAGSSRIVDQVDVQNTGQGAVDMGAYEYWSDCNNNGAPDHQEIEANSSSDCQGDGVPDECQLTLDCNNNDVPDECDLAGTTSDDCNNNSVPDECEGDTIYVDSRAYGRHTGRNWTSAYMSLQQAVDDAANCRSGPVQILVAQGTYYPDATGLTDPRDASFQLTNGVTVLGGYAGNLAADPNERDVSLYQTVLSGDLNGDDDLDGGSNADNTYHVFNHTQALALDSTAVLDGVTITAGNANGATAQAQDVGGGFLNAAGNAPTLIGVTFRGNEAQDGGAICNDQAAPKMVNCIFAENVASNGFGGAIYNLHAAEPDLVNCTFNGNTATLGGAMYNSDSDPVVVNSVLWGDSPGEFYDAGTSDTTIDYSCIQSGTLSPTNIISDPQFVDAAQGNLRLSSTSPCINIGDNASVASISLDVDGNARTVDGKGTGTVVDMGAYEYFPDCNNNGKPDGRDIAGSTSTDCNVNGIPDECDMASGTAADCNTNGLMDDCEIAGGTAFDCDENGVLDECEIALGTSSDCNTNGVPDDCEIASGSSEDYNGNGILDECETLSLANAFSQLSHNGSNRKMYSYGTGTTLTNSVECRDGGIQQAVFVFDMHPYAQDGESDLVAGDFTISSGTITSVVVHEPTGYSVWFVEVFLAAGSVTDGEKWTCSFQASTLHGSPSQFGDCWGVLLGDVNGDGELDAADESLLAAHDNELFDDNDYNNFTYDLDLDGIIETSSGEDDVVIFEGNSGSGPVDPGCGPDPCETVNTPGTDCDSNGFLDECDIRRGNSLDCNTNGVPDICDIASLVVDDCNTNGVPDECEIASGSSEDYNANNILDECETLTLANAYSQLSHNGTARKMYSYGTNTTLTNSVECRDGGIQQAVFVFDMHPYSQDGQSDLVAGDFTISSGTITSVNVRELANYSVWFVEVFLAADGVTDGERWTCSFQASTLNGTPSYFSDCWGVLAGDVNGDGQVDSSDESALMSLDGQESTSPYDRLFYDLDLDGAIEGTTGDDDLVILQSNLNSGAINPDCGS